MGRVVILTDSRYALQRMPAALTAWLRAQGVDVRIVLADQLRHRVGPPGEAAGVDDDAWADLAPGDVVLARTRNRAGLAALMHAERPGVRVLTPAEPIAVVRDKARTSHGLAEFGVPTPATWIADSPAGLRTLPSARFPLLLKPHAGDNARGIVLVRDADELDDVDWPDSMVLAQQYMEVGGVDLKVYVAGQTVWAVRRPSPLDPAAAAVQSPQPVEVSDELREIALRCGRAFGLVLYGIDVLECARGGLVVDVNEFPNYTGVEEAPAVLGGLVLDALSSRAAA